MSALAAELNLDASNALLALGASAPALPGLPGIAPEPASAPGAARAARQALAAWLKRCLHQGVYRQRPRAVPALPLGTIEAQLQLAVEPHAQSADASLVRADLLGELRGIDALASSLTHAGKTPAEALRIYDQLLENGLAALHQLAELEVELTAQQAWLDPLTELPGRRALEQRLQSEHARVRRHVAGCALVLIDLDRFKPVNDLYGHLVGDRYLAAFAATLRKQLRPYDAAFRYGGDEFVLCLPETSVEQAAAVVERLRAALDAKPLLRVRGAVLHAEFSAGVAALDPARSVLDSVAEADAALYAAKARGARRGNGHA
jgi:diguanylate cyclase (GGDEF)-like protein